jgi:hypothetical protein
MRDQEFQEGTGTAGRTCGDDFLLVDIAIVFFS